jgi:hypothetical protein
MVNSIRITSSPCKLSFRFCRFYNKSQKHKHFEVTITFALCYNFMKGTEYFLSL